MHVHYLGRRWRRRDEEGFTLIELLVCMLIISILAAAATQIWFHQRRKAWVAQVHAGVRHMAGAQNNWIYELEGNSYTLNVSDLEEIGFNFTDDVVPTVVAADRETFCVQVASAHDSTIVWHYASVVGYPQEGPADEDECGVGPGSGALASTDTNPGGVESARQTTDGPGNGTDPGGDPDFSGYPPGFTGGGSAGDQLSNGGDSGGTTSGTTGGTTTGGSGSNDPPPTTSDPTWDDQPGGSGGGDGGCRGNRLDPDGDSNGGRDEVGGVGGNDPDRDCNNGSGNDDDGDDDNNAGGK